MTLPNTENNAGENIDHNIPKAQDLHSMLRIVFKSYIKLQKTGFTWSLSHQGKVYKDIEFVMFTPFLKLDSDKQVELCAKFTS